MQEFGDYTLFIKHILTVQIHIHNPHIKKAKEKDSFLQEHNLSISWLIKLIEQPSDICRFPGTIWSLNSGITQMLSYIRMQEPFSCILCNIFLKFGGCNMLSYGMSFGYLQSLLKKKKKKLMGFLKVVSKEESHSQSIITK